MARAEVEGGGCAPVPTDDAVYGGGGSPGSGVGSSRRFRSDRSRSDRASSLDRGSAGRIPVAGMSRALFVPGSSHQSQPEAARAKETVWLPGKEGREKKNIGCLFTW